MSDFIASILNAVACCLFDIIAQVRFYSAPGATFSFFRSFSSCGVPGCFVMARPTFHIVVEGSGEGVHFCVCVFFLCVRSSNHQYTTLACTQVDFQV
jgi:hypothetical protein